MTSPSVVREADINDEPEIWRLFRLAHEENGLYSLSEDKVRSFLAPVLFAKQGGVIGVIGRNPLEAIVMLVISSPWYSRDIAMDDCLSFVDPEHRQSDHAKALIAYAKTTVDGIRQMHPDFKLTMGIVSTDRTAAKVRLFSQQLTPVGVFFAYPPPENMSRVQKDFVRDWKRL
jgi:hypothetical protein